MLYCVFIVFELYVMRVSQTLTSEISYVPKMKFCLFALLYFWKLQNVIYQIVRRICPKWKKVFSRLCKVFVINQLHATWHTAFGRHETFTSQHTGTAFENVNIFHKIQVLFTTYLFGFLYPISMYPCIHDVMEKETRNTPTPTDCVQSEWQRVGWLFELKL